VKTWIGLAIGLIAFSSLAPGQDIIRPHKPQKVTSGSDRALWSFVRRQTGVKTYVTHKGEDLAEVSQVLFGDRQFWPKIWAMNKGIADPHHVPAGTVLTFVDGDVNHAPYFGVPWKRPQVQAIPEVLALTPNMPLPQQVRPYRGHPADLPDSLPYWAFRRNPDLGTKLDLELRPLYTGEADKLISIYAADEKIDGVGEVIGVEGDFANALDFQYIYVRFSDPQTAKHMTLVRNLEKVKDFDRNYSGEIVQVDGEVDIAEVVNVDKNIYRALVTKSYHLIEVGDRVTLDPVPVVKISEKGPMTSVYGHIVWGQKGKETKISSLGDIVVVDIGREQNVQVGQLLTVYRQGDLRVDRNPEKVNARPIGVMRVMWVSKGFGTAMIIQQSDEVHVGDTTTPNRADQTVVAPKSEPAPEASQTQETKPSEDSPPPIEVKENADATPPPEFSPPPAEATPEPPPAVSEAPPPAEVPAAPSAAGDPAAPPAVSAPDGKDPFAEFAAPETPAAPKPTEAKPSEPAPDAPPKVE